MSPVGSPSASNCGTHEVCKDILKNWLLRVVILAEIKLKILLNVSDITKLQNRISIRSPTQASQNRYFWHVVCRYMIFHL